MCYHAEFGRSRLNGVDIREIPKIGSAGALTLVSDPLETRLSTTCITLSNFVVGQTMRPNILLLLLLLRAFI